MEYTYSNEKFGWNVEIIDLNQHDYEWSRHKSTMADALCHFERIYNADLSYPIIINEKNKIIDGWHRIIKAKCLDIKTIKCVRIKMPDPDFCLL